MPASLPLVINPGDVGHIGHHEVIHSLLDGLGDLAFQDTVDVFTSDVTTTANFNATGPARFKTQPWADITHPDFGAATSATPATNTSAINAACGAATVVFIPSGDFSHDGTLTPQPNTVFFGGGYSSNLAYTGAGNAMAPVAGTFQHANTQISDVRLSTTTGVHGIYLADISRVHIHHVEARGFSGGGITSNPSGGNAVINVTVDGNCELSGNGYGIYFTGANGHNRWTVTGNTMQGNLVGGGIHAEKTVNGCTFVGNDVEGNTLYNYAFLNGASGLKIDGGYIETNAVGVHGIQLAGAGSYVGVSITGLYIQGNVDPMTGRALYITSSGTLQGIKFNGNAILGGYGKGANPAIDGGGKIYFNCDFSGNSYPAGVITKFGTTFASFGTGSGTILERQTGYGRLDFPNVVAGTSQALTIAFGDIDPGVQHTVVATPTRHNSGGTIAVLETGLIPVAYYSATGTVTIRLYNVTGADINPTERDWYVEAAVTR